MSRSRVSKPHGPASKPGFAPKSSARHWALLFLWSLVIGHWSFLPAQAVAPRLANILPTGGQRGTELEVRFTGQRLDDTREIVFYTPGLSVASMEPGTNSLKATLKIAPDCRLGEHQIRLRTATGVSELRTFWVSPYTNVTELEPNSELAKAQRLQINCTVAGTIPSEDMDFYVVTAAKGQRLTAEVEGMRLGRGTFDPYVCIQDKTGKILDAAEDSALGFQDGVASILAPEDGDYFVQVRETSFGGRDDYQYRLHVGSFPRPTGVHPIAGRAGETVKVKFLGDVKGEIAQSIQLPSTASDRFGVFAQQDGLSAPSPNWMRVTPFLTAAEVEPNDTREQVGEVRETPVVFNGVIAKPGDHDWFRFRAKKGQNLQVTVYARRLRSPLDSTIQVVNAKGSSVAENDDAAGPDSSLTFKPDEDGDYAVLVRDHLKRGGPDFAYCIEVAPVEPSVSLKIPEVARNDTQTRQYIAVPRGNRFATLLSVKRTSLGSDLTFRADQLPAGMKLLADTMPAKVDQFPVVFEADADAVVTGKLIDLFAVATNKVEGRFRNDIELVQGPNNTSCYGTQVDKLLVAVTEAAPFKLRIVEPKVPLVQGGSMELKVVVERDPGFDEPVQVKMVWNPPGVSSLSDVTIPKGSNSVIYPLNAKGDADLRSWQIAVIGSAKVHEGDLFVSSQLTKLQIGEPFVMARIEPSACEPGKVTNITVKLEQKIPFTGKATIRLIGLPEKVVVPEKQITKDDTEVVFNVKVDSTCPTGSHKNLFCSVAIQKDGDTIPHSIGAGGILRIVPPKKPADTKPAVASAVEKKVARNEKK